MRTFPGLTAGGLAIVVTAAIAPTGLASAGAPDKNCCFAVSVQVAGAYTVQYGDHPENSRTGDHHVVWNWAVRELVGYNDGRLRNLGSKVVVSGFEASNVRQKSLGPHGSSDATQEPVPCDEARFETPDPENSPTFSPGIRFINSAASQLGLGRSPAGKPALTVGLGSPYAQLRPHCQTGEEGDHADKFNLDLWSYRIPGPSTAFLRLARRGDKFAPPDFNGGTLAYSHPYGNPSGASPHAFTGSSAVSVRMVYFPKSELRTKKKQLKQCKEVGQGACGPGAYPARGMDPLGP